LTRRGRGERTGLTLAGLALFLLLPRRIAENTVVLNAGAPRILQEETTIRNVTQGMIRYTIAPHSRSSTPVRRRLEVGAVDRIRTDSVVEISFDNGSRQDTAALFPGRPYSFRYDEEGLVRVYPGSHGREDAADLAPYVPTPQVVVKRMLELARVGPEDVVYDIGCGDGRMVITAAERFKARGVGIDIDAKMVDISRRKAKKAGVEGSTRFMCMDGTKARLTEATVLALYLLPESLEVLAPLFEKDLRPGSRIVSHNYKIPGWEQRLARTETVRDERDREHRIYLYEMPAGGTGRPAGKP
jgi:SAM-dependent methyltransferase